MAVHLLQIEPAGTPGHRSRPRLAFVERVAALCEAARYIGPINFRNADIAHRGGAFDLAHDNVIVPAEVVMAERLNGQSGIDEIAELVCCRAYRFATSLIADAMNGNHEFGDVRHGVHRAILDRHGAIPKSAAVCQAANRNEATGDFPRT
ncbi:hypothetical protein [Paraburkholderia sp. J12]|uniref:hypothetical protein n=1 Tax=Paraburkholderia sp. J12 TaxID=2805432 RepID=UPI002ABD44BE|nr:hypothetical protein [Paraburkholderia sp. J12]